ncbi:RHS repeat-associated core domain-containing protein [Methylomonas methanica]|uniref:RHS repeat-associated core domain protein n=1 Tax=Methylomonas methanica (strain DSM 25384 / MC09) TaxID=857087 RepID=G0A556_METMM|nr:RHS repeat-associated core domain-containing protein [Methylomonas methanica]AEG00386.1 RHS repeat-associated core domain protein [Methylomonas methanica MC09]
MKNQSLFQYLIHIGVSVLMVMFAVSSTTIADPLAASREIIFAGTELEAQAQTLATPAAIYEFVRNTHEYALYHGSRSNTLNTYGGRRGSDVDIASVLIAMYRSQGMPARYAVGQISVPQADVANWLAVKDNALAKAILEDQGIQGVVLNGDHLEFEHVWVQVLIPFDDYRGATASNVNCTNTPNRCQWIDIDPSYKLRQFHNQDIAIHDSVSFNYTDFYNAIKDDNPDYRDKGPLESYEQLIMNWLPANGYAGKTLEDVADPGTIVLVRDGLMPASLPYGAVGPVTTFDDIASHDDSGNVKKWAKYVTLTADLNVTVIGTGQNVTAPIGLGTFALADLSTKRLTVQVEKGQTFDSLTVRLDGVITNFWGLGDTFTYATPNGNYHLYATNTYTLHGLMDGAPAISAGGTDNTVDVQYDNLLVGGMQLIATGGYTSNWSQVHRAAAQLLEANTAYPVVFDPAETGCTIDTGEGCTPYVDANKNNLVDVGELKLLDDYEANNALTGGLLYTASNLYFTRLVDRQRRLDALMHVDTLIDGFIGVVSSTDQVEYLDNTAFSVMPGGLLIDLKGLQLNGSYRNHLPATISNKHFELFGHIMSSLEHEVWQELTGYDAVSTVRGIQMAMAQNTLLATLNSTSLGSNSAAAAEWSKFGFADTPNLSGYTYDTTATNFGILGYTYNSLRKKIRIYYSLNPYSYGMEVLKKTVDTYTAGYRKPYYQVDWNPDFPSNSFAANIDCFARNLWDLYAHIPNTVSSWPTDRYLKFTHSCNFGGTIASGGPTYLEPVSALGATANSLYALFANAFNSYYTNNGNYFDFFDQNKGFIETDYVFRNLGYLYTTSLNAGTVQSLRDNVLLNPTGTVEYIVPGRQVNTGSNRFFVYLYKQYGSDGTLQRQKFSIANAGGGYVDGSIALEPASTLPGVSSVLPGFNNDQFTDKQVVSQTNNDQIRTPSTVDPVSTVTGNNYHDETDLSIRGRGLDYVLTRTYNSAKTATKTDGPFGFGWTHSYGMTLKSNDYGICPNCTAGTNTSVGQRPENGNAKTSSIVYSDERGGEHNYLVTEDPAHTVTTPRGEFDTLALNTPAAGQYTLGFRNGVKYIFENPEHATADMQTMPDKTARLIRIEEPFGSQLTLTYDAPSATGKLIGVTDNLGITGRSGLTITYHPGSSHIKDVTDWSGRQWQYAYDASGNLLSVTDPLNQIHPYTYNGHLLHEVTQPLLRDNQSVKTTFNYYQNGRVFNYHNTVNQTETLDYDLYRQTTRVTDPRGGIREYHYDADGRMTKLTEPDKAILRFENQADGIRNKKYDALGYATTYSYRMDKAFTGASDSFGNVTREQDALNQTLDTGYGPYDQVASIKDKRGTVTTTAFYSTTGACALSGKPQSVTVSALNSQTNVKLRDYCWNADGTLATLTEYPEPGNISRKRTTAYTYEAGNQGLNVTDINVTGSGQTLHSHYTYDNLGRILTETVYRRSSPTDATQLALTTTFEYDALDRPVKVTDPEGRIKETVYDANGQVAQEKTWYPTDATKSGCAAPATINGTSYVICTDSSHQYDAADRRIASTDVLGHTTRFAYDAAGNLTKVTDANGHITQYQYDAMNRRSAVIDGNGRRTETKYNLRGEAIAVTNANGETIKSEYDAIGRLTKVIDPLGFETQYQYDANGNQTCRIDANEHADTQAPGYQPLNADGYTESRQYDELNRLTQSKDAQNHITAYSYDLFGNRLTITDAENRTTTFHYDDLGRLIEIVDPLIETPTDKTQTFAYDEAGNVIETTDRKGQTNRYSYDRLNRNTQIDHLADASQETYTYDTFGDLIQSQNADVSYSYTYDAKHQLQSKTDSRTSKTLGWTYDPAGNIDTKTDYQGDITTYQTDSANRLVAETNPAYLQVSYHYDGAGRLLDRILSNGAITHYGWDAAGRLTQLKNTTITGELVNDTQYTRDRLGNILSQTATNSLGQIIATTTYTYDPAYRLKTADYPGTAFDESFSYDKVGNRKTHTLNGGTKYYNYNAGNRLQNIRTGSPTGTVYESYQYDDNGSLTNVSGNRSMTLTWDANNRVKQINSTQYRYDPKGYRIHKAASLTSRYYLEGEHLEAIYDGNGALRDQYLRGTVIDEVVNGYHRDANNLMVNSTYHHDALQSVLGQSAHDGNIQATQTYTAFGGNLSGTGTSNAAQKYTGREADGESGFYYYRARYYDPVTGRFISVDPLGFDAGINFYVYCLNNPINCSDPSGKSPLTDTIADQISSGSLLNNAYKGFDAGLQLGSGAAQLALGRAIGFGGVATGNPSAIAGGSYLLTAGVANIQGAGSKYFNIAANEDFLPTNNFLQTAYQNAATSFGLNSKVGTAAYNVAELATGLYGALNPTLISQNWDYGLTVTGPKYTLPILEETGAVLTNSITSIFKGIYDSFASINEATANGGFVLYPNKANTNQIQSVYNKP